MKIIIINGPNLNLLGKRQPEIYGSQDFESFYQTIKSNFDGHQIDYFQSNSEGALVDKIQEVGFDYDGIILNAAAYTHTSVAIADAIAAISTPVIEVHISNIHAREEFRKKSLVSSVCVGMIAGLGLEGYLLALTYFINQKND